MSKLALLTQGNRKLIVVFAVIAALFAGFLVAALKGMSEGLFIAYVGGVVGAGGWFFKANTDIHKAQAVSGAPQP